MNKIEAIFAGGDRDGALIMIDEPHAEIISIARVRQSDGKFKEVFRTKYKLVAKGPPLRYLAED